MPEVNRPRLTGRAGVDRQIIGSGDVTARRQLGPEAERALRAPVEGTKRRKVLALIGIFADAGKPNPSVSELAERAHLPRSSVIALIDRLERDGFLAIERAPRRRNSYRLLDGRRPR